MNYETMRRTIIRPALALHRARDPSPTPALGVDPGSDSGFKPGARSRRGRGSDRQRTASRGGLAGSGHTVTRPPSLALTAAQGPGAPPEVVWPHKSMADAALNAARHFEELNCISQLSALTWI